MTLPLYLAPMAGITDQVFRRICFQHGCDFATTEMISAQGFLTAPKDRNAYRFLLARFPDEGPLAAQLFGSEPHFMAPAAARLTDLGLIPGTRVTCTARSPSGDPRAYLIRGTLIALRNADADHIWLERREAVPT